MALWKKLGVALIAAGGLGAAAVAAAGHYEAPRYDVVESRDAFEVREYAPRVHAEVTVSGSQRESASTAFRILASYIFGQNQPNEKIGMTVPVGQQPRGEKIGMTVPVGQQALDGAQQEWVVWFMMPGRYTIDSLPAPQDSRIALREEPAHRAAVLTFRGKIRPGTFEERAAELTAALDATGLESAGPPTLAQFSPPSVPGFLRRNEIQIPLR